MIYWRNCRISEKQQKALILFYRYRGLTNEHLRVLIFGHLESNPDGQKANISRYVSGLRKLKLIESQSCYPYSKELIHYLTNKGIEFVKTQIIIVPKEHKMGGFDCYLHGDFDALMLKPPLKNKEHTMMYLNFAIQYRNNLTIRHNLYAVQEFCYPQDVSNTAFIYQRGKIRPDGEILLKNEHIFSLEIDTGTERFEQLVAKFKNYRRYFDYCIENDLDAKWIGILFVCKESYLAIEKDIRVHTIIRAAVEGLQYYCWTVSLQIFRRDNIVLKKLLEEDEMFFKSLDIPIPSKKNPIKVEKQLKAERLQLEEEERKRRQEEAQRSVHQQVQSKRLEYERRQKLEEDRRRREIEEEENKKKGFLGRFFS